MGEHAKLITQLTIEGRHAVEEGIDFDADIDLLDVSPYSTVEVHCGHGDEPPLDAIMRGLKKDMVWKLWIASSNASQPVVFTSSLIRDLGSIFRKYMER
jgi:hypothetical protein